MASRILFNPISYRVPQIIGLSLSTAILFPSLLSPYQNKRLLYCDTAIAGSNPADWSFTQYQKQARTPIVKNGKPNPGAIRQISSGSICGMSVSDLASEHGMCAGRYPWDRSC